MPSVDELFDQMEEQGIETYAEEAQCIIDADTRTITVPPEYQLLGVESDEKVERLYFQCPKIVGDNVDLSQLILFINYQNAGQEIDAYKITDVETDGDNITFSWLLDRKVTAYRTTQQNKLGFSFCAQKADEDGTLTQEWNTTVNTECSVLEGLEAQEHIEEENSAAIAQIWQAIDELKAGGGGSVDPEQIKQAVKDYLEENPVSGMTAEQEQQLNQNTTDVADLKSAMSNKTLPIGGTTGQVLAKKSDADYDVEWTTIKNTGTVEPPSKEDTLLGALPYRITESNCYIISETEAQITTGEGPENLYIRNGEYLVGNPEGVEWGVDSLKYTPVDNLIGVYTHVGESNSFKPNTKYTLFADFESEVSLFIRVIAKSNDINPFLGDVIGQLSGSGYLTFTIPENIKWLNLSFGFITKGTGKFYNIAIYEGEYTERPKGGVFTLPANTKFNTDAYIGSTLSPVNEEVVSVYKVNTEDSENETNKDGVIFFGDSILDFSGVAEKYSKRTGKPVLDCAVGGTRLSGSRDSGNEYYPYDMTNIADSIASGDFSSQVDGGKNSNFSILNSGNLSAYKTIILEFRIHSFSVAVDVCVT